jgi:N-acetylmuramic acid 6-phosphate etherase
MSSLEIVTAINNEDQLVANVVREQSLAIAKAIDYITEALRFGGRLIYIGAGTSGRLGVLDASECPPTFGTDPSMVVGVIAGGYEALQKAKEGSEDNGPQGWLDLLELNISKNDILCGIMASGRTPYVVEALEQAAKNGIKTIVLACNSAEQIRVKADVIIALDVGAEAIMGSTRMKAGTAQKMVLNMLSTGSMIRLGKVYQNIMVDLQMNSAKLVERAKKIIMHFCHISYKEAEQLLNNANGHVKLAIVMQKLACSKEEAAKKLDDSNGFIKPIIEV